MAGQNPDYAIQDLYNSIANGEFVRRLIFICFFNHEINKITLSKK